MILQPVKHKTNQFFHINASFNRIFTTRIEELTTTDPPIQTGKVTIFPLPNTTPGRTIVSCRSFVPLPAKSYVFFQPLT